MSMQQTTSVRRAQVISVLDAAQARIEEAGDRAVDEQREATKKIRRDRLFWLGVTFAGPFGWVLILLLAVNNWRGWSLALIFAAAAGIVVMVAANGVEEPYALLLRVPSPADERRLASARLDAEAAMEARLQSADTPDSPGAVLPPMLAGVVAAQTAHKRQEVAVLPAEGAQWRYVRPDGVQVALRGVDRQGRLVDVTVTWPADVDATGLPEGWPEPGPTVTTALVTAGATRRRAS